MAGFAFTYRPQLSEALALLCPGASFRSDINPDTGDYDYDHVVWLHDDSHEWTPPTKDVVEAYLTKIQEEWDLKVKYKVLRKQVYPDVAQLADAIYHQSQGNNVPMEAYIAAVQAVKEQFPKNDPNLDWRGSAKGTVRGPIPSAINDQQNPEISLPDEVFAYLAPGVVVPPEYDTRPEGTNPQILPPA